MKFDPNAAAAADSGIFGLPCTEGESALVFVPVPWEATTSYGGGTSCGPQAILDASKQVDLYDLEVSRPYEAGMYLLPESEEVRSWNKKAMSLKSTESSRDSVNKLCAKMNDYVYTTTKRLLDNGKLVGLIGGDHSTPYGAIKAVAEKQKSFGILHFDAHSDTRKAFEGFTYSHASIMYNVLKDIPQVIRLIQVGIRDFCEEEIEITRAQKERVAIFFDREIARRKFEGSAWAKIAQEIVSQLPQDVWISFDIDALDPRFCPHTGTPVPGGLDFNEAIYLISLVAKSGRKIIGFDLNEVAPNQHQEEDEWDANVGARLLYQLSAWALLSHGKAIRVPA